MEVIESKRGGQVLCYEGFAYNRINQQTAHEKESGKITWRCSRFRKLLNCKGSITTNMTNAKIDAIIAFREHNHPNEPDRITALKLKSEMKKMAAADTDETPADIISKVMAFQPAEVQLAIGHIASVKRILSCKKRSSFISRKQLSFSGKDMVWSPQRFQVKNQLKSSEKEGNVNKDMAGSPKRLHAKSSQPAGNHPGNANKDMVWSPKKFPVRNQRKINQPVGSSDKDIVWSPTKIPVMNQSKSSQPVGSADKDIVWSSKKVPVRNQLKTSQPAGNARLDESVPPPVSDIIEYDRKIKLESPCVLLGQLDVHDDYDASRAEGEGYRRSCRKRKLKSFGDDHVEGVNPAMKSSCSMTSVAKNGWIKESADNVVLESDKEITSPNPLSALNPADRFSSAKLLCENLALLMSEVSSKEFESRYWFLKEVAAAWKKNEEVTLLRNATLHSQITESSYICEKSDHKFANSVDVVKNRKRYMVRLDDSSRQNLIAEPEKKLQHGPGSIDTLELYISRLMKHAGAEQDGEISLVLESTPIGEILEDCDITQDLERIDDPTLYSEVQSMQDVGGTLNQDGECNEEYAFDQDFNEDSDPTQGGSLSQGGGLLSTTGMDQTNQHGDFNKDGEPTQDLSSTITTDQTNQHFIAFLKCRFCSRVLMSQARLSQHEKTHERTHNADGTKRRFECELCKRTLCDMRGLEKHMRSHRGDRPYVCNVCNHATSLSSSLRLHMRIHSGERPYTCMVCDRKFMHGNGLRVHMEAHLAKRWKCDLCLIEFSTQKSLRRHRDNIHPGQFERAFRGPRKPRPPVEEKLFICPACGLSTKYRRTFQHHMNIHNNLRPFTCDTCPAAFYSPNALKKHVVGKHTSVLNYICNVCGAGFPFSASLRSHIRIHSDVKPFQCGTCQMGFRSRLNLIIHERLHTGERPYHCGECGKTFRDSLTLSRHRNIHTGYRPHTCSTCGKGFKDITGLALHERVHSGERPEECPICPNKFATKGTLRKHLRCMHTCAVCNEQMSSAKLKEHKEGHCVGKMLIARKRRVKSDGKSAEPIDAVATENVPLFYEYVQFTDFQQQEFIFVEQNEEIVAT